MQFHSLKTHDGIFCVFSQERGRMEEGGGWVEGGGGGKGQFLSHTSQRNYSYDTVDIIKDQFKLNGSKISCCGINLLT